jgi:hypothetical protein
VTVTGSSRQRAPVTAIARKDIGEPGVTCCRVVVRDVPVGALQVTPFGVRSEHIAGQVLDPPKRPGEQRSQDLLGYPLGEVLHSPFSAALPAEHQLLQDAAVAVTVVKRRRGKTRSRETVH